MTTQITGTVIDGQLHLDQPLALPDQSRVTVTIVAQPVTSANRQQAFGTWWKYLDEHPIDSGGLRFTREELHERH